MPKNDRYRSIVGGMASYIDAALVQPGQPTLAKNVQRAKIGQVKRRDGSALFRAQIEAGKNVDGLFYFDSTTDANDQFIAKVGTKSYYDSTGWTQKETGLTDGEKHRYASFTDLVYRTNITDGIKSWDGTAGAWGATNLTSAPAGKFIQEFQEKLHIGKTSANKSHVYFSSTPSLANAITWDTDDNFPVAPDDGSELRGMAKVRGRLILIKDQDTYFYNGNALTHAESVGTTKEDSVAASDNLMFLYRNTGAPDTHGFYIFDGVSYAPISEGVRDYIDGIGASERMPAIFDGRRYFCFVGDTNGETNVIFEYDLVDGSPYIHTVPYDITVWALKDSTVYFGTSDGKVYQWMTGNQDDSTNIDMEVEGEIFGFDIDHYTRFQVARIITENAANATIAFSKDGTAYGSSKSLNAAFTRITMDEKARILRWKVSHSANEAGPTVRSALFDYEDLGNEYP